MPDHKDIQLIARHLEELQQKLQGEELSIDQTICEVKKAVSLYQTFKKYLASCEFKVEILQKSGDQLCPKPFDWKELAS